MNDSSRWDRSNALEILTEGAIRLAVLATIVIWCYLIVSPFTLPVMWGVIIAVAIFPLFSKLASALGGRTKLAVIVYAVIALALLIIPTVMISGSILDTTHSIADKYEAGALTMPPPNDSVKEWPVIGEKVHAAWTQAADNLDGAVEKYKPQLKVLTQKVIASAASAGGTVLIFIISILISAVLISNSAGAYKVTVQLFARLTDEQRGEAFANLSRDTIRSIAQGVLGIAIIQSLLAGVGMYLMDVPAWGLWTLLILVFAIVQLPPLLVLGFVVAYVFSVAATTPAVIFAIYALFVSTSDMFLKPLLLGRGLDTPMLVILLGAIGGMLLDGVIGLFVGAVVLALGYELFMAWLMAGAAPEQDG